MTQFVQAIDTDYAAKFLHNYTIQHYQPWVLTGVRKIKSKSAAELMVRWLGKAHEKTLNEFNIVSCFEKLGYSNGTNIAISRLPYTFTLSVPDVMIVLFKVSDKDVLFRWNLSKQWVPPDF